MGIKRAVFLAGLVCLAIICAAWGQGSRATISGAVTDPSGSAVPNASVKASRAETSESQETKTNNEGRYTLPYLNPGIYNIEVKAGGFQTLKREAIVVQVGDKLNLNLQLTVGAVTESITVTAQQEVSKQDPPTVD